MPSLYELSSDLLEIDELLNQMQEDDIAEEDQVKLAAQVKTEIEKQISSKNSNIIKYVRELNSDIDVIRSEEKRLAKVRKQRESKINYLKDILKDSLQMRGLKKVETPLGNITLRTNAPSVVVDDIDDIPKDLCEVTTVVTPNKNQIKALIQEGKEIKGCHLVRSQSVILPK